MKRTVFHIVLGVLLWIVFGYYWYLVVRQPVAEQTRFALTAVGSIVGTITLFLCGWVIHNVRIARNRNRRRERGADSPPPLTDFLGRTFVARNDEELRLAPYVEVHLVEISDHKESAGHKIFRVADSSSDDK